MSFKSYRSSQSKFRRINRLDVSAQSEPCELRALLSASAITVGMDGVSPSDCVEEKAGSDEVFIQDFVTEEGSSSEESDPSLAYTSFMLIDNAVSDDTLIEESPVDGEESDPSLAYTSFMPFDNAVSDDTLIEEFPADGSENPDESGVRIYHSLKPDVTDDDMAVQELFAIEDTPPADGWDPSWAYRSAAGSPDAAVDDAATIDDAIPEDGHPVDGEFEIIDEAHGVGWEESWAWRTLDQPDGVPVDSVGEELPDDFVMYPYDPISKDQLGEDGLGCGVAPEGFVPGDEPINDFDGDGLPDESVIDPVDSDVSLDHFDPRILMNAVPMPGVLGADFSEVIEFGDTEFHVSDSDDSSVPQIRFLSAVGGSEVQRTLASSSAPAFEPPVVATTIEATTNNATTSALSPALQASIATNVVPARQVASNSLFNSSRDKTTVEVLTPSSSGATVGSSLGTKATGASKRAKSQLQSTPRNANESSELESLSPLTEEDEESPEVTPVPAEQDVLSDEKGTAEPNTISHNSGAESTSSVVVQNTRQPRLIRPGMIDEVMSDYAQNSFNA